MMKKIIALSFISFILFSANTLFAQENSTATSTAVTTDSKNTVVTPENFQEFALNNVGKEVEIKGMVLHVCQHSGKKMFIIGEDPEKPVKIDASDKVSVFGPEFEGSTVLVKGIIEPIAEEEVPEAEKATQDAEHTNHYHTPQFSISCLAIKTLEE